MYIEKNVEITEDDIDYLLDYWTNKLGLHDWEVKVVWIDIDCEDEDATNKAQIHYVYTGKQAIIHMCTMEKYQSDENNRLFGWDMEETLVHELLHIKFYIQDEFTLKDDSLADMREMQNHILIEEFARLFVQLSREGAEMK